MGPSPEERLVAWLWTDTLANLLMEHDAVAPDLLRGWIRDPVGYRLGEGVDPLALARALLAERQGQIEPGRADGATLAAAPSL